MDFRRYKAQVRDIIDSLSDVLYPMNEDRTIRVSYGSCFRLPTFLTEPYFIWRFGPPANEQTNEEFSTKVNEIRSSSVTSYKSHSPNPTLNRVTFGRTLDKVRELLGLTGTTFNPISLLSSSQLAAKSTSSGFPDYMKKIDIVEDAFAQAATVFTERDASFIDLPVTLAWRTQVRKSGIKYRLIWLVPFVVVLFEMQLFEPIIRHIQSLVLTSYCIGNVFPQLATRYNTLQSYKYIYSLDYESYDSTISPFFLNLFFSFNKEHLALNPSMNWLFEQIRRFHMNAQIITGFEGEAIIFRKRNGLLSGSFMTNYLGSFVNLFFICYFLIDHNINPIQGQISVMGDDSLFGINELFTMDYISDYFLKKFGVKVSVSKSEITRPGEPVFFLGSKLDNTKRYINFELIKEQLKISTSFSDDMSEFDRVFSKLCSSLFKYTDGWRYYLDEIPYLREYFNILYDPTYYIDVSTPAGGPTNMQNKIKSVQTMMYDGWRLQ